MTVKWNYKIESLFASSSLDKRLAFWDLTKIGNPQSVADSEEGPPELLVNNNKILTLIKIINLVFTWWPYK